MRMEYNDLSISQRLEAGKKTLAWVSPKLNIFLPTTLMFSNQREILIRLVTGPIPNRLNPLNMNHLHILHTAIIGIFLKWREPVSSCFQMKQILKDLAFILNWTKSAKAVLHSV